MNLAELRVWHRPKRATRGAVQACGTHEPGAAEAGPGFALETCQRSILVTTAQQLRGADRALPPPGESGEWLRGASAYCFLLELAAGLKSALVGECEIVAQLKSAWSLLEAAGAPVVTELRPWIQGVLADAKEVREQYLRGTGGQSYGSLLRHALLEARGEARGGAVLLVGAGKLATEVLPYLGGHHHHGGAQPAVGHRIFMANRTVQSARALRERMQPRVAAPIAVLGATLEAELEAWNTAELIVLCVPLDAERDAARVAAALARPRAARPRIAHLGILATADTPWSALEDAVTLETLFALDRRQAALRGERIALAHNWCGSRSRLRALDRCVSIAHGWEDLAGFAVGGAA